MRGATAEQLATFMLQYIKWRQELQQQLAALSISSPAKAAPPGTTAARRPAAAPQQQQPAARLPRRRFEGQFGPFPALTPLPSVTRRAAKLVSTGAAEHALFLLCPASSVLLLAYIAKARNRALLQHLMQHKILRIDGIRFPSIWLHRRDFVRYVQTGMLCSCAALASGDADLVALLQLMTDWAHRGLKTRVRMLLSYATRHSSAACISNAVFACAALGFAPTVAPQHLAMAAGRTDPWAAEAVQALLQSLPGKQLRSRAMKEVYRAACRTGHGPVMQLLLQVREHISSPSALSMQQVNVTECH